MERVFERWLRGNQVDGWLIPFSKKLRAEHERAVRVVKREIEAVKNDQRTYHSEERCLILGSLETVLKALQKGRT